MKAAVLEQLNAPLVLHTLAMGAPLFGQVHVRILAAGICGAQLQEIRGEKSANMPMPRLLGHEACAEVVEVGDGVTTLERGDKVVVHWRKGEGIDVPHGTIYHHLSYERITDVPAGPVHTFCTEAIISENRCTTVPHDTPSDLCCLLGCALSTALGVLENDAKLRMGESLLVVGCGGVGLSLISAAKMMGAVPVDGMDKDREPQERAFTAGASLFDPDPHGIYDCIVDTSGSTDAMERAIKLLAPGGRYILVGQPAPGESLRIPNARHLFDGTGATIIASQGGQFNPAKDLPRYVRLWRAGLLKAAGITHRLPLEGINEGLDLMREGKAGRVIIEMNL